MRCGPGVSAIRGCYRRGKGAAPGERETGRSRPAIAIIGDGSFQYSVQSIWTAAALGDTPGFPALICPASTSSPWQSATVAEADQTRTAGGIGAARAVVFLSDQRRAGRRDRSVVSSQCA